MERAGLRNRSAEGQSLLAEAAALAAAVDPGGIASMRAAVVA